MNVPRPEELATVSDFLAHAHALECECEDRLTDLAGCFEAHNNPVAAETFRQLERLAEERVRHLEQQVEGHTLPKIAPWACSWHCAINSEALCIDRAHYMMNRSEVLRMVREKLVGAGEFYRRVAEGSPRQEVREMAGRFLAESRRHVAEIEHWLEQENHIEVPEDLDAPSLPR